MILRDVNLKYRVIHLKKIALTPLQFIKLSLLSQNIFLSWEVHKISTFLSISKEKIFLAA